jgi:hypothetical protein
MLGDELSPRLLGNHARRIELTERMKINLTWVTHVGTWFLENLFLALGVLMHEDHVLSILPESG